MATTVSEKPSGSSTASAESWETADFRGDESGCEPEHGNAAKIRAAVARKTRMGKTLGMIGTLISRRLLGQLTPAASFFLGLHTKEKHQSRKHKRTKTRK
jgi:hypothetical protein